MSSSQDAERLFDSLSDSDQARLIAKKLREMPFETRRQIIQQEIGDSNMVVVVGSNIRADIALSIQTADKIDVSAIIEAVVEHCRNGKHL